MCKWCESSFLFPKYLIEQEEYQLYIDQVIKCLVLDSKYPCDFELTIKYCPFCGKEM